MMIPAKSERTGFSTSRGILGIGVVIFLAAAAIGLSKWLTREPAPLFTRPAVAATAEPQPPKRESKKEAQAIAAAAERQPASTEPKKEDEPDDPMRIRAPELDGGVAWLNSAGPLRLRDLRGKIVLLDFWTLCCINCMHMLPDLARLEKKYPNELVVIGVHSAKFENERNSESIRKAILRYEISHPVVNDANMRIWRRYLANSWPTLVLVDPEGYEVARGSGEGLYEAVDRAVAKLVAVHRRKKTLDEQPLALKLARVAERTDSPLYFPGTVLADAARPRLFI